MLLARIAICAALLFPVTAFAENWPVYEPSKRDLATGSLFVERYHARNYEPVDWRAINYDPIGNYMDYASGRVFEENERTQFDKDGVPMIAYNNIFRYNPVTVSQFTIGSYARGETDAMLKGAERLLKIQRPNGAMTYLFPYKHYANVTPYATGWISGMAQGQTLSAFARAWHATKDDRYREAGEKALDFLQVREPVGPMFDLRDLDPSLSDYIWFDEYLTDPSVYTLNGYIFTLFGLYDWWKVAGSDEAKGLFEKGVDTLVKLLPYFDAGTFSSYDIGHITMMKRQPYLAPRAPHMAPNYHQVHIRQLGTLYSMTGKQIFADYAEKWSNYVH